MHRGSMVLAQFFHRGNRVKSRARDTLGIDDAVGHGIVRRAVALIAEIEVKEEGQPDITRFAHLLECLDNVVGLLLQVLS